jgi:Ser-tRNA(Ala) deacylase AlaX
MQIDDKPASAVTAIAAEASHNKDEFPPMHTAEHILNATMVAKFGCLRSMNAHIEKKKSKCDYDLPLAPTEAEVAEIEQTVNEVISRSLPVSVAFMSRDEAARIADLRKLPADTTEKIRIVRVGDYDACACVGAHVANTSEIGARFKIISSDWNDGVWRVRFRLEG